MLFLRLRLEKAVLLGSKHADRLNASKSIVVRGLLQNAESRYIFNTFFHVVTVR